MTCVGFLIRKQVFTYCFLIIGGLGIVYVTFKMICGSQAKGDLLIKIEAKREKLFGKNDLNRPIKYIEMTQMNLKAGEEQGR